MRHPGRTLMTLILFNQHAAAWQGDQSGPMSEEQLARLAQNGDQSLTGSTVLYPGYAGNVCKHTLAAGMYAFMPAADGVDPGAKVGAREGFAATTLMRARRSRLCR